MKLRDLGIYGVLGAFFLSPQSSQVQRTQNLQSELSQASVSYPTGETGFERRLTGDDAVYESRKRLQNNTPKISIFDNNNDGRFERYIDNGDGRGIVLSLSVDHDLPKGIRHETYSLFINPKTDSARIIRSITAGPEDAEVKKLQDEYRDKIWKKLNGASSAEGVKPAKMPESRKY